MATDSDKKNLWYVRRGAIAGIIVGAVLAVFVLMILRRFL